MTFPRRLVVTLVVLAFAGLPFMREAHGQSNEPLNAVTWSEPPPEADNMSQMSNLPLPKSRLDASEGQDAANYFSDKPKGQRWLNGTQVGNFIVHDGWVQSRENPNDRTIATTLTGNISGESRTSIAVEAMPYGLSDGHEILIQTGDWTNPPLLHDEGYTTAYVDGGVSSGDTSISIDDGSGNPVTITASTGDRVLSDFQSLWPIHAREQIKTKMQDFMTGFVNAGGNLDGIALDTETGLPATKGVKHDPRWDEASMGVDGVSYKGKLAPYTIDEVMNNNTEADRKWTAEIKHRVIPDALNEAVVDVIQEDFPDATASDYHDSGITESEIQNAPNSDLKLQPYPHIVGTHATWPLYSSIRSLAGKSLGSIRSEGSLPYEYGNSAWATLRYQVKLIRTMVRENNGSVQPWIPYEGLTDFFFNVDTRGTKYWEEHLIQMALHTDPNVPLLSFNARGAGGGGGSDADDLHTNSVLQGINEQLDGQTPTLVTPENITWTTDAITTAVDLPDKRLWRVTVRRVDPWDDRKSNTPDDPPIDVSLSNGDTVTVPSGEVGFWYETDKNTTLSASFTHPPVDNLLPSDDWIDLTSGVWTKQSTGTEVTTGVDDPDGGNNAFNVTGSLVSDVLELDPNTWYTVSFWGRSVGNAKWWITKEDDSNPYQREFFTTDAWDDGNWHRTRAQFQTDGTGKARLKFPLSTSKDVDVYKFMLNRGKLEGPYEASGESTNTSQSIVLQQGGNLVSTAVQPSDPDLETVFGDATSALAQVETETGQVFDPDTGTDEIGTWDASAAYKIYAETPTSFVVEGTALDSMSVSLDDGLNWLPYPGSTSVAIDQALEPIQNELVMVKDETGRVYRPSQGTTQIDSLKPGAAYKILLENPVTLSYPLR